MTYESTGLERFLRLVGISGAISAAWLLVPFAIGLALLPLEDTLILSEGWKSTLWSIMFGTAWVLGLVGAIVVAALTCVARVKMKTPGRAIPLAIVVSVIAYAALSYLAILGLAEFYFADGPAGFD